MTRLNVAGLLREPAGTSRTVELGSLEVMTEAALPRRVLGTIRLQRTNRGIVASGRARTLARWTCIRCLDEFDEPVEVEINEEFLPMDPTTGAVVVVDAADVQVARVDAHHEIDLAGVVNDELTLAEPMHPLCRPDCGGLCPICGLRRDDGVHDHPDTEIDPRLAGLADWKPPAE
ncbi:MAG TPA: DUF177 domain-containing protein [Candidatus Limnocylindrales bacterium]